MYTTSQELTATDWTIIGIVFLVGQAVALLGYNRLRHRYSWRMLGFRRPNKPWVWQTIGLAFVAFFTFLVALFPIGLIGAIFELGYIESGSNDTTVEMFSSGVEVGGITAILAFISVVILPPIVEEMFFRGVIHNTLRQRFGFWITTLVSSAIFGVVHIAPIAILHAFIMGVFLAWVYERYDSLWPPILIHIIRNGMVGVALVLAFWG